MRVVFLVGLLGATLAAQEHPSRQQLPPSVAEQVQRLHADLERLLAQGQVAAVKAAAAEVRKLHAALPGTHWQRRSGDHLAATFEQLAALPDDKRKAYLDAEDAVAQATAARDPARIETALTKALATHEKLFPAPSHQLADTYRKIAVFLRDRKRLADAKGYAEASLAQLRQVWGEHPWVARGHILLADLHDQLGEAAPAEEHARRAWELARRCVGSSDDLALGAKAGLVRLLANRGQDRRADAVERLHLLEELELGLGRDHADTIAACRTAADALGALGDAADAEPLLRRVLAHQEATKAPVHDVVGTLNNLVRNLVRQDKLAEVEALARRMVDLHAKLGDDHPGTPTAWFALGEALLAVGKIDDGLHALNKGLALRRKQLGEAHAGTVNALNRVGNALDDLGRPADAETYFRQALDLGVRLAGPNNGNVAALRCNLGNCLLAQGKLDDADKCLAEAVEALTRLEGGTGLGTAMALANLGGVRLAQHKFDAALALYRQAHDAVKDAAGDNHPLLPRLCRHMATALHQLGKNEQAEAYLERAIDLAQRQGDPIAHAAAQGDLAEHRLRRDKAADAEPLARSAVATLEKATPGGGELALALATLGRALDGTGKPADAEANLRRAASLLQAKQVPLARQGKVLAALGLHLHRHGQAAEAEPILRKALDGLQKDPLALPTERAEVAKTLKPKP